MTARQADPFSEFLKTFFCTRSLWTFFGVFWAAMALMTAFWTISFYVLPEWYYIVFLALFTPCFIGFILYKKRHPDFLSKTAHRAILESGTLPRKLAVFLFVSLFAGPLGWGPAVLICLNIYCKAFGYDDMDLSYSWIFFGFSLLFSSFMAAFLWIDCIADRKRRMVLKIAFLALFLAIVSFIKFNLT
jgi:hypothetical protein